MPEFELAHVRKELQQAIDALDQEVEGALNSQRARAVAGDHVLTAWLLLTGSTSENIVGHPRGSHHNETPDQDGPDSRVSGVAP